MREEIITYRKCCTNQRLSYSRFKALSIDHFNKSFNIVFVGHFLENSSKSSFKDYVQKTNPELF